LGQIRGFLSEIATARDVEVDWKAVFQIAFKTRDMKAFLVNQAPPFLQYKLLKKNWLSIE